MKIELSLPPGFRLSDFLAYHGRDPQSPSEKIEAPSSQSGTWQISKALEWKGHRSCLRLRFEKGQVQACLEPCSAAELTQLVVHMLGLEQPIQAFEERAIEHPQLGFWIRKNSGLRIPQAATPFEALAWAICGQQISVKAALAIRRRWLQQLNLELPSGLLCHPEPGRISQMPLDELRGCGFSEGKARALLALSQSLVKQPDLKADEPGTRRLLSLPGIGPWTVNYGLLRGYGQLDACLHGDAAVLRALRRLYARTDLTPAWAEAWFDRFRPFRALAAAHLWASLPENQP